ncbi:hypothetical protein BYT27DRAFT_6401174 [Phlegmacium glaucopus]|nr:hypothetical protein BYT27DRAFT_6401174 [Phlegmacium glaucopus]
MLSLRDIDWLIITNVCPVIVGGFLFGLYTGCFLLYLYLHAMKTLKASDAKRNYLIYPLCTLYGLSALKFGFNMSNMPGGHGCLRGKIEIVTSSLYYFLSQSILIYRCWIVWGRRTSVAIIPLLLALAALGTTLSRVIPGDSESVWCLSEGPDVFGVHQGMYLAIDGLVMGLIILKIAMVYLEVRPVMAHSGRDNKFRPVVFILFILIESGSVIFATQLCYIILYFQHFVASSGYGVGAAYLFIGTILAQVPLNLGNNTNHHSCTRRFGNVLQRYYTVIAND